MRLYSLIIALSVLFTAGCESRPDGTKVSPFSPGPGQERQYAVPLRSAYAAAKVALQRLDCELTDLSGAPYRLEAASRIFNADSLGDTRQLVAYARFGEGDEDRTRVTLTLSVQTESGGKSGPSAQTRRQHGFYDLFFETLAQVLQEQDDAQK